MGQKSHFILDITQINKVDLDLGKKANLLLELKDLDVQIPTGFVITYHFFKEFLDKTGITRDLEKVQKMKHPALNDSFAKLLGPVRKEIMRTHIPQHLLTELHNFYRKLAGMFVESSLNIHSSSKENKSIAFYDILGDANLILKIKTLLAHYLDQPFSVIVQKSVLSQDKKSVATNDANISDQNVFELAKKIQNYFYFPQEIDYYIKKDKIFVTGIRPFTKFI